MDMAKPYQSDTILLWISYVDVTWFWFKIFLKVKLCQVGITLVKTILNLNCVTLT